MSTRGIPLALACGALVLGVVNVAPATAGAPGTGTCWNLTNKDWDSGTVPNAQPVDCASSHTAEALGSLAIPKKLARGSSQQMWAWAYQKCHAVGIKYVWGAEPAVLPVTSYALPMTAQLATFGPTKRQWRSGQRWVSCVGFNMDPYGSVLARAGTVAHAGLLPNLCVSWKNWKYQACGRPQTAPMTNVVWLSKSLGEKFPGKKAVKRAGSKCKKLARSADLEASTWYVPGKGSWNYGNRFGYCSLA